ncbi:Lipase (class 3) [Legionella cherrii]|uniref:Lipase (Class 3) n=1 Tax=Legionella cherrii TaxID=28084 RepID=A0A0W0S6N7_9GAMM|nr:Mbeg1-like protein [Legionella cherrii]KTC78793.1 Lipase (class 3) [Legionella cherrii]
MPKCTIRLLLDAAQLAYRIEGKENKLREDENETSEGYIKTKTLIEGITKAEYEIQAKTNPEADASDALAAVCLKPIDDKSPSPIIISYRGTASIKDVSSNINLTLTGTVGKKLQEEAYDFYEQAKKRFPNREIIIVGHSLGGHLAQYVGARAYATDKDLRDSRKLHVRTFNTASIDSLHGRSLTEKRPDLLAQFCNYRLDMDIVSGLPVAENLGRLPTPRYYGNTFSFCTDKNRFAAHPLRAMREVIPDPVQDLEVGGMNQAQRDLNMLKEAVLGIKEAYAAHIKGQWFSTFRMGSQNKKIIDKQLDLVTAALNENPPDFEIARMQLSIAKHRTSGPTSYNCLDFLTKELNFVKSESPEDATILTVRTTQNNI